MIFLRNSRCRFANRKRRGWRGGEARQGYGLCKEGGSFTGGSMKPKRRLPNVEAECGVGTRESGGRQVKIWEFWPSKSSKLRAVIATTCRRILVGNRSESSRSREARRNICGISVRLSRRLWHNGGEDDGFGKRAAEKDANGPWERQVMSSG